MVKIIKKYILFLIFLACSSSKAMEKERAHGELLDQTDSLKPPIDINKIEEFVKNGDLKKTFNFDSTAKNIYCSKLNILANVLLFQQWIINQLGLLIKDFSLSYQSYLSLNGVKCLSIKKNGQGICDHKKDHLGNNSTKIITSQKAIQIINTITRRLLNDSTLSSYDLDTYYDYSCELSICGTEDEDTSIVAKYNKYLIEDKIARDKLKYFIKICENTIGLAAYDVGLLNEVDPCFTIMIALFNATLPALVDNEMSAFIQLCLHANSIYQIFRKSETCGRFNSSSKMYKKLVTIVTWWNTSKLSYKKLYDKVVTELHTVINNESGEYKQELSEIAEDVFLYPPLMWKGLPISIDETLDSEHVTPIIRGYEIEDTSQSFLDEHIINHNIRQISSVPENKKSKKTKIRRRRRKKKQTPNDEQQNKIESKIFNESKINNQEEHLKLPVYADRTLEPFYTDGIRSDTYHIYSPVADPHIIKYGTPEKHPNATFSDQMDTRYYLLGKMVYDDDRDSELVEFCVTIGVDKKCYHRGFKVIKTHEYDHLFPLFNLEQNYCTKRLLFDSPSIEIYGDPIFMENDNLIKIKDHRNGFSIILLKTENNNIII